MATGPTVTENVDLAVNAPQLDPIFRNIELHLAKITGQINKISATASEGTKVTFNQVNAELKKVQQALRATQTLQKLIERESAKTFQQATADGKLAQYRQAASSRLGAIRRNPDATNQELAEAALLKKQIALIDAELKAKQRGYAAIERMNDQAAKADLRRLKESESAFSKLEQLEKQSATVRSQTSKAFHQKELAETKAFNKAQEVEGARSVAAQEKSRLDSYKAQDAQLRQQRKDIIATARAKAVLEARASFSAGTSGQAIASSQVLQGRILNQLADSKIVGEQRQILIAGLNAEQARVRELNNLRSKENALLNQKLQTQKNIIAAEVARDTAGRKAVTIEELRAGAKQKLLSLQRALSTASASEEQRLNRLIKLEQHRVTELNKQLTVQRQSEAAAARSVRQQERESFIPVASGERGSGINSRRSIGNILSPGYAAAAFARTSVYGAAALGAYSIFDAIRGGMNFVTEFEDGMKKLQAITNSTNTQMLQLSQTILDVSTSSRYATSDIIESSRVLAQAGLSIGGIAEALPSILQLATASGESLQQTTDVVTSALGSFQLNVEETSHIADVLTASLNNSKLNLQQVALGIQYAGQTAKENNISFEELVATLATMAQAGIRSGSTQGTGIRQFLTDLATPTKKLAEEFDKLGISFDDVNVKTRGLPAVMATLADKGFDASSAYSTLEVRAAAAYLVLKNNTDEIIRQIESQQQMGLAAQASAKSMDSLSAQWQRFKNVVGAATSENTGGVLGFLTSILDKLSDISEQSRDVQNELNRLAPGRGLKTADILSTPDYTGTSPLVTRSREEIENFEELRQKLLDYQEVLAVTEERAQEFARALDPVQTEINSLSDEISNEQTRLESLNAAITGVQLKKAELKQGSASLAIEVASLTSRFPELALKMAEAMKTSDGLAASLRGLRNEAAGALSLLYARQAQAYSEEVTIAQRGTTDSINKYTRPGFFGFGSRVNFSKDAQRDLSLIAAGLRDGATPQQIQAGNAALQRSIGRQFQTRNVNSVQNKALTEINARASVGYQARIKGDQSAVAYQASQIGRTPTGAKIVSQVDQNLGAPRAQKQAMIRHLDTQIAKASSAKGAETVEGRALTQFLIDQRQTLISSLSPENAPPPKSRAGGGSGRTARNQASRNEAFVERDLLSLLEKELKSSLDNAKGATTNELFRAAEQSTINTLRSWEETTRDLAEAEIKQKNMSPELAARYRAQTEREITDKRKEIDRALGESFTDRIDRQLALIDKDTKQLLSDNGAVVGVLESRMKGFDRFSLRGRVTDADRVVAESRLARAQEDADRSQIGILSGAELAYRSKISDTEREIGAIENTLALNPGQGDASARLEELNTKLGDYKTRLQEITDEKMRLNAAFEAGKDLPVTFQQSLDTAVEAYITANDLNRTFMQDIQGGLMGVVGDAHQAFTGFFTDIASGTRSVSAAFGNMALSILKSLNQLVAQAAANQIFSLLLGLVSPSGSSAAKISVPKKFGYNGGLAADLPGYDSGGLVTNGSRGYDSVVAKLRKNEFVLQPGAVDSVGVDFLNDLNKRGSNALRGLEGANILAMQKPPTPVNVYVVAPEHKQQMGPNDVLAVIADDVLRDGTTKKLIRAVAAGA